MSALAPVAPLVDQRVALTFAAQGNARTKWIEIEFPEDAVPTALFEALAQIGFIERDGMARMPAIPASHYDAVTHSFTDLGYRKQETHLTKAGTDLFTGWTAEEERANMRAARAVLRRFGFVRVPVWKKTLADML